MHLCLILFPGFPLLAHALIGEVLRLANACAGQTLFTCCVRTVSGAPVESSCGVSLAAEEAEWQGAQGFDLVLLAAGAEALRYMPMGMRGFLTRADQAGATLGGIGGGGRVLAQLGFLDGHIAALDPALVPECATERRIALSDAPFVFDRNRLTTAGGVATADALLAWIARIHGTPLAFRIGEALAHGRLMESAGLITLPQDGDPVLREMHVLMSANLSRPLSLSRIAAELGQSPKQLRSRCRKLLRQTPAEIYRALRLNRADSLIRDTGLTVAEVAHATGFASPSSFTRSYREVYGAAPRAVRKTG